MTIQNCIPCHLHTFEVKWHYCYFFISGCRCYMCAHGVHMCMCLCGCVHKFFHQSLLCSLGPCRLASQWASEILLPLPPTSYPQYTVVTDDHFHAQTPYVGNSETHTCIITSVDFIHQCVLRFHTYAKCLISKVYYGFGDDHGLWGFQKEFMKYEFLIVSVCVDRKQSLDSLEGVHNYL